ncbi:hypothetical protein TNCV_1166421 [Trichonephila clavipes]|uniref:Uncharacterized protein n=1 Tax=Trichonephila clavipes TaxID=2585209 RepID=A0A8X6SWX1_TRICX|nr:hypothetical protein TNCV_1166421 [Trichonephila clavipes]
MLLMYAQNDVKDDFPSTKAEKGGGHTIWQFMSVRLSEENLIQARIKCLAFWIVSLEQEHWSVGDKLKRFKEALKFPCPVRNWLSSHGETTSDGTTSQIWKIQSNMQQFHQ